MHKAVCPETPSQTTGNKAILIQSRLSSSRLPGKMLMPMGDVTLIEYVYNRCLQSKEADSVIVITSDEASDDPLASLCHDKGIPLFRGSLNNVLERYYRAAEAFKVDLVCRICGDSPFVDIAAVDALFTQFSYTPALEYGCVTDALNGLISEICSFDLLKKLYNSDLSRDDQEHVTKFAREHPDLFKSTALPLHARPIALEHYSLTVDYPEDLVVAQQIASRLDGYDFTTETVINVLTEMEQQ